MWEKDEVIMVDGRNVRYDGKNGPKPPPENRSSKDQSPGGDVIKTEDPRQGKFFS